MVMNRREAVAAGAVAAAGLLLPRGVLAQEAYPNRPIKVLIGFAAGSGADILCRFFIARMTELSGQSVVIENRPGAVGVISANMVAKSKPDGYTMWWGGNSIMVGGKYLVKDFPFDAVKEFIPAGAFLETPFVLAVGASSPVKDVASLVTMLEIEIAQPLRLHQSDRTDIDRAVQDPDRHRSRICQLQDHRRCDWRSQRRYARLHDPRRHVRRRPSESWPHPRAGGYQCRAHHCAS